MDQGPGLRLPSTLDPAADLPLEDLERHRALAEDDVVELADVEAWPERVLGVRAQLTDLELSHLVAKGLTGPHDVTIDLDDDVRSVLAVLARK